MDCITFGPNSYIWVLQMYYIQTFHSNQQGDNVVKFKYTLLQVRK
jgi:hypothetical protein